MEYHQPVLLAETLEYLRVEPDKKYIDCTLGDGGHTREILGRGGQVLGIDFDTDAVERATQRIIAEGLEKNFTSVCGNFANIDKIAKENGFGQVNGVLYDLGYSFYQLGEGAKGLSFLTDQPLDMRLDQSLGVTAADLVNALSEKELTRIFYEYSDERYAKKIAQAIVIARSLKKIETTKDLTEIIVDSTPPGYEGGRIHPATRTFQALRIATNLELENLKKSLPRAACLLLPGGRMTVISFHSKEDEIAKRFGQSMQPRISKVVAITKKPVTSTKAEVDQNTKARSAKLRVYEKV